ncbi:hypothetical protein [Embleya sp. AB8]|uniref:hypothetical protein n=1 Tax=Embleya sp. AB8 TaxID=3156304 RepID=UPI003C716527
MSPTELFGRYEQSRFMYPAKRARLAPHWPVILENWQRARRAGELLNWVVTYDEPGGGWASMVAWRSTHAGWHAQHLVGSGSLAGGHAVMLATQAVRLREGRDLAHQNWFSPDNRFSALAFGGAVGRVGPEQGALVPGEYLMVPLPLARALAPGQQGGGVDELDGGACPELADLARRCRGGVYARAEGLDRDDLGLGDVDRLYRLVGLRRYRRIWVRYDAGGRMRAAAVAYRGPLGFNFSFLENRCDLLISPELDEEESQRAVCALLAAAGTAYDDFELAAVPLVADAATAGSLVAAGAQPVRSYSQAVWLAEAFPACYRHIDDLYAQRLRGRAQHPRRTG